MSKAQCLRCGQCCHYQVPGVGLRKCKFLITLPSGKTLCRIYKQRLGTIIDIVNGKLVVCVMRKDDTRIFPGCPLNSDIKSLNKEALSKKK